MSDPKLDAMLRAFLDDHAEAKRKGVTLERVYDATANLGNAMALHEKKDDERFGKLDDWVRSTDRRVTHLEADVENLKDKADDTGEHAIDALKEASEAKGLAAARRSPAPSKGTPWYLSWPAKRVAQALALLLAAGLGLLLRHLKIAP